MAGLEIKLITLFLILITLRQASCVRGDKSLKVNTDTLVTYMKFGFLQGGTISKKISMGQSEESDSLVYLLVCDQKVKESIVDVSEKKNVCQKQQGQLIAGCQFKHVVFNDPDGLTKVLPFRNLQFIQKIATIDSSTSSKSSGSTDVQDISGNSLFNALQGIKASGDIIESSRIAVESNTRFLQSDGSQDHDIEDWIQREKELIRGNHKFKNETLFTNEERRLEEEQDQNLSTLETILQAWLQYEDPLALLNIRGRAQEMLAKSEDTEIVLTPQTLPSYLNNSFDYSVQKEGTYWFLMINCVNGVSVDVEFLLLNPNGEHLSVGELENKEVYYIMIILWAILSGFWVGSFVFNLFFKRKTYALHYYFLASGLFWSAFSVLEEMYWTTFSNTGYPPLNIRIASAFIRGTSYSLFLALFLLIGKGYTYINFTLTRKDKRDICLYVFIRVILTLMSEFFGSNIIVIIVLVGLYIAAFVTIFLDFKRNLNKIVFAMQSIQSQSESRANMPQNREQNRANNRIEGMEENRPEPSVRLHENVSNNLNAQEVNPENRGQNEAVQNLRSNEENNQRAEDIRRYERNKDILKKKILTVKLLRFFILSHIIILCISYIVSLIFFLDKPYVANLWSQVLIGFTYIQITWFFNFRYKHAFSYSSIMNINGE